MPPSLFAESCLSSNIDKVVSTAEWQGSLVSLRRLRNEEAQLAKAKRIGGGDIGKSGRAAGTRGSAAAGGRLDPVKPRRSTNDAPSVSASSIGAASTSSSASRSVLAHRLAHVYIDHRAV